LKYLVEVNHKGDIPLHIQQSENFVVLKSASYKYLDSYLQSMPENQSLYLFIWSYLSLDMYLKLFEDYSGDIVVYRCYYGDGNEVPMSPSLLSRFNYIVNRRFKNPTVNLNYVANRDSHDMLDKIRMLF